MYNESKTKHFIKHCPIFKLFILFFTCVTLLLGCSNQLKNSTSQVQEQEQIKVLNAEIVKLQTQLKESKSTINNLNSEIENLMQELDSRSDSGYLETLQWIQEIAFDNRVYPGIYEDSEDKIVEKIIKDNIIKIDDNEVMLDIGICNKKDTIYDIEALVYERVNLMLESGGIMKTIKFTVDKTDEGLKIIE